MSSFRPSLLLALLLCLAASCRGPEAAWPPEVQEIEEAPVLSPAEALETFALPPGYRIELVAAEPLVQDPVAIDFDADGRLWVVEMRGFMPDVEGEGETRPVGRIVVLEDDDDDGRMDRQTVFLDSLVLPRAVRALADGVLVGEPPHVWFAQDTDGDLRADRRTVVTDDYSSSESNPEHAANGLLWGMDNWIYSANYGARFRRTADGWLREPTLDRGQWGISMDDFGRFYRNSNEDPLRADLAPPHYYTRNPNQPRTGGVYEQTVDAEARATWPIRTTRGVNRGYREGTLRDDGTLAHFTAAGSPVVYRGDRLPEELRGDVFITEPAGNFVRRFTITDRDTSLHAANAYQGAEFLASTDERFRPVNLYSAPDGTLYVVDMYRGVIQHRYFLTDYLKAHIRERGLEQPVGLGRIYRVVHTSTRRAEKPQLSREPAARLVRLLEHPNGWWRDAAQQLLVTRRDSSVAPALRGLAGSSTEARTRLHALWTLDGLGALDLATLNNALKDPSPHVRAAAVRLAEPRLAEPSVLRRVVARADDPAPQVRLQLAFSLGSAPPAEREPALAALARRAGEQPFLVDAVVSSVAGRELEFLDRVLADTSWQRRLPGNRRVLAGLAAAVMKENRMPRIDRMLALAGSEARLAPWQRLAVLDGVASLAPRSRRSGEVQPVRLAGRPAGLDRLLAARDTTVRRRAQEVEQLLAWPGKPGAAGASEERTPEQQQRFRQGEARYLVTCAPCHQANGQGMSGVALPLAGSPWVLAPDPILVRILLHGKEGEMMMPPMGGALNDEEIAAVLTYIRGAWGNAGRPVGPATVRDIRLETAARDRPWTEDELNAFRRGRGPR